MTPCIEFVHQPPGSSLIPLTLCRSIVFVSMFHLLLMIAILQLKSALTLVNESRRRGTIMSNATGRKANTLMMSPALAPWRRARRRSLLPHPPAAWGAPVGVGEEAVEGAEEDPRVFPFPLLLRLFHLFRFRQALLHLGHRLLFHLPLPMQKTTMALLTRSTRRKVTRYRPWLKGLDANSKLFLRFNYQRILRPSFVLLLQLLSVRSYVLLFAGNRFDHFPSLLLKYLTRRVANCFRAPCHSRMFVFHHNFQRLNILQTLRFPWRFLLLNYLTARTLIQMIPYSRRFFRDPLGGGIIESELGKVQERVCRQGAVDRGVGVHRQTGRRQGLKRSGRCQRG